MNSPIIGLPATSRRLRELEEAIATQRKLIAAESTGYDAQAERENLTRLLRKLDELLAESDLVKQRETDETLDRVLIVCPL
jgi:hypothetical protein